VQCNPETGVSRVKFASAARPAADSSYNTPEVIQGTDAALGISNRSIRPSCLPMASLCSYGGHNSHSPLLLRTVMFPRSEPLPCRLTSRRSILRSPFSDDSN
jgi:hypothetical protein